MDDKNPSDTDTNTSPPQEAEPSSQPSAEPASAAEPASTAAPSRTGVRVFAAGLLGVIVGAVLVVFLSYQGLGYFSDDLPPSHPPLQKDSDEPGRITETSPDVSSKPDKNAPPAPRLFDLKTSPDRVVEVATVVAPSVVYIDSTLGEETSQGFGPARGQGSGVIYSSDGYIITNDHVVTGASSLKVTLSNGQKVDAKIVGKDPENDIAVIRIPRNGLSAATFGRSEQLKVGEMAVAVGSPFGLQHSVTAGIVSALGRNLQTGGFSASKTLINLVQTDAPIHPGNSGGALANHEGKVVGINTMIFSTDGVGSGIGLAIPSEVAVRTADQLIRRGRASRPYIGVCIGTLGEGGETPKGIISTSGALVTGVFPAGPAGKAGIKNSEVIIEAAGRPVATAEDLIARVRSGSVGERINLKVETPSSGSAPKAGSAKARTRMVTVTLAERPTDSSKDPCGNQPSPREAPGTDDGGAGGNGDGDGTRPGDQSKPPGHP